MFQRHKSLGIALAMILMCGIAYGAQKKGDGMVISAGKKVSFNYTLTVDGEKVDSSDNTGPLTYTHGSGQIIKGLETELEGMKAGEKKQVTVSPQNGYGEVNPEAFKEIPKTQLPPDMAPAVGQVLTVTTQDGQSFPVIISEVKDEAVVLNLNHPLAGKELHFDVAVVSVE